MQTPKKLIRPSKGDVTAFLRMLFQRTERDLLKEIARKRENGYVDYAERAALERVQAILQNMIDESWDYIPQMLEQIVYSSSKDYAGYKNARALTVPQMSIVQQLSNNLLGSLMDVTKTTKHSIETFFTIARLENDPYRKSALEQVLLQEAAGSPWIKSSEQMLKDMQIKGITGFVDRAGRRWSMEAYCNMAVRTTARQAQVAALLTEDEHDLWQISKIGSTCPVCAPLEGRVYSKSGTNPDYPPLSLVFGKIDPEGGDELSNTWLNIHPNCMHALTKYTTIGKSEKQIQKDKDFSSFEKNPRTHDPRTKKQIEAYRTKERNRQKLLADMREHKEYRAVLGNEVPKDFTKFREMKYNEGERFGFVKLDYSRRNKLITHPEFKLPNAEKAILPEGKFTRYLLGGSNESGLAKGRAISDRLGYDLSNWEEFRREIAQGALRYPATEKGNTEFGQRYEQKMILYGKLRTPANVVVGWLLKPDGSINLTSAYIKEVD